MEHPVHKGSSSQVKFCFSDDQARYHTFSPIDEMGNDIRSCHSSPCFASFDDPRMVVGSTTMEGKREPSKKQEDEAQALKIIRIKQIQTPSSRKS